jgi:hypothetical protein
MLGLAVGVLATPLRRSLLKPWIYLGAAIALGMAAPSIVWQSQHHWPFLELGQAGMNGKNIALSPLGFFGQQVLFAGPLTLPVWLAGLWLYSTRPPLPAARAFAIAYVIAAVLFYVLHGKAYYLTPIYPTIFAGGAVALDRWLKPAWLRNTFLGLVAVGGALLSPFAIPVLPVQDYIAYSTTLGFNQPAFERGKLGVLPQQYADMFGWHAMAAKVAAAYHGLPPADQAKAVFLGANYGEAGAIDVFGPPLGLPPAISGHNNYYLWGPRNAGAVLIVLGDPRGISRFYGSVQTVGRIDTPYAMPYETDLPVNILRDPKVPLTTLWPMLKHYE